MITQRLIRRLYSKALHGLKKKKSFSWKSSVQVSDSSLCEERLLYKQDDNLTFPSRLKSFDIFWLWRLVQLNAKWFTAAFNFPGSPKVLKHFFGEDITGGGMWEEPKFLSNAAGTLGSSSWWWLRSHYEEQASRPCNRIQTFCCSFQMYRVHFGVRQECVRIYCAGDVQQPASS